MGKKPEWRWQLLIGIILVFQSFFKWNAPLGPWEDESFSRGVIALVGIGLIYVAKYRWQFEKTGIIPYLHIYKCKSENISKYSLMESLISIGLIVLLVNLKDDFFVPEPASLIILLYSSLMFLHAIYAWLVNEGPLSDEEE